MGTRRLTGHPSGRSTPVDLTAATPAGARDLVVEVGDDPDPTAALAANAAVDGPPRPVVDRTGTPLRGAVAGRDLFPGDHLVAGDQRNRPALVALTGPLQGAWVTADRELVLGRGGRFGAATIDDDEVSRQHLRVWPSPGALLAEDLGSTNGTLHDDEPMTGRRPLRSGDRIQLGGSGLVVVGDPPRHPHVQAVDGRVLVRCRDERPDPLPEDPEPDPVAPVGRWARRRARRTEPGPDERRRHLTSLWEQGQAGVAWRRARWPDPTTVAATVAGWSPALWSRHAGHPAHLVSRLGQATVRLAVDTGEHPIAPTDPRLAAAATHDGVPVTVDLRTDSPLGVVGPPAVVAAHLAAWTLHLAALQRPSQLGLVLHVEAAPSPLALLAPAWRWLPHGRPAGVDGPRLAARWEVHVVDVAGRSPTEVAARDAALAGAGRTVVWVAGELDALPLACATRVELSPTGDLAVVHGVAAPDGPTTVVPDLLAPHLFEDLARLLAPLVEAAPSPLGGVVDEGGLP